MCNKPNNQYQVCCSKLCVYVTHTPHSACSYATNSHYNDNNNDDDYDGDDDDDDVDKNNDVCNLHHCND